MKRAVVVIAAAVGLSACGSNMNNEDQSTQATGSFPVSVSASFPTSQHLAQSSNLVIKVTNTGQKALPNVAVTLINPQDGTGAQALGTLLAQPAPGQPILAGRSRPVWVIDQAPGKCGYSCQVGGPGGGATAYSNTWALGSVQPGATETFDWHVTALKAGSFAVEYKVAAGLSGNATATGDTDGQLAVTISEKPRQGYVNNAGQAVYTSN